MTSTLQSVFTNGELNSYNGTISINTQEFIFICGPEKRRLSMKKEKHLISKLSKSHVLYDAVHTKLQQGVLELPYEDSEVFEVFLQNILADSVQISPTLDNTKMFALIQLGIRMGAMDFVNDLTTSLISNLTLQNVLEIYQGFATVGSECGLKLKEAVLLFMAKNAAAFYEAEGVLLLPPERFTYFMKNAVAQPACDTMALYKMTIRWWKQQLGDGEEEPLPRDLVNLLQLENLTLEQVRQLKDDVPKFLSWDIVGPLLMNTVDIEKSKKFRIKRESESSSCIMEPQYADVMDIKYEEEDTEQPDVEEQELNAVTETPEVVQEYEIALETAHVVEQEFEPEVVYSDLVNQDVNVINSESSASDSSSSSDEHCDRDPLADCPFLHPETPVTATNTTKFVNFAKTFCLRDHLRSQSLYSTTALKHYETFWGQKKIIQVNINGVLMFQMKHEPEPKLVIAFPQGAEQLMSGVTDKLKSLILIQTALPPDTFPFKSLKKVVLYCVQGNCTTSLATLLRKCLNLEELSCWVDVSKKNEREKKTRVEIDLSTDIPSHQKIKSLSLINCIVKCSSQHNQKQGVFFPSLKKLYIEGVRMGDDVIDNFSRIFPALKEIVIPSMVYLHVSLENRNLSLAPKRPKLTFSEKELNKGPTLKLLQELFTLRDLEKMYIFDMNYKNIGRKVGTVMERQQLRVFLPPAGRDGKPKENFVLTKNKTTGGWNNQVFEHSTIITSPYMKQLLALEYEYCGMDEVYKSSANFYECSPTAQSECGDTDSDDDNSLIFNLVMKKP